MPPRDGRKKSTASRPRVERSIEAERIVLASILQRIDPELVFKILQPQDFSDQFHRRLFADIKNRIQDGQGMLLPALVDEMRLDDIERALLAGLFDPTYVVHGKNSGSELRRQAELVQSAARLRELKSFAAEFVESNGNAADLLVKLQARLSACTNIQNDDALLAVELENFLGLKIPEREKILDPILESQGLAELHAPRGTGKTCFALAFGLAVASGGTFLKWRAPKPRRTLYLDGEMPAVMMQSRLSQFMAALDAKPQPGFFKIITPDLQPGRIPDLASAEGRALLKPHMDAADFIIVDNLSAWVRSGVENESESWLPIQDWLLGLRRDGKTSMFLHHSGKSGLQRGTSKREDLLDLVINLKRPSDYRMNENLRAEVHFEKSRTALGTFSDPFEICLDADHGSAVWTMKDLGDALGERAQALYADGLTVREVAASLGISRSAAGRLRRPAALSHVPR